jgi:hypothetical protein
MGKLLIEVFIFILIIWGIWKFIIPIFDTPKESPVSNVKAKAQQIKSDLEQTKQTATEMKNEAAEAEELLNNINKQTDSENKI